MEPARCADNASGALRECAPERKGRGDDPVSDRTTLHRYAHRAGYDRPTIDAIHDQGIVSHAGLQTDDGFPVERGLRIGASGYGALLMCGVVGLLLRDCSLEPRLGSMLFSMIEALDERGPDSCGIAVYSDNDGTGVLGQRLNISLGSDDAVDWDDVGGRLSSQFGSLVDVRAFGAGTVVVVPEHLKDEVHALVASTWPNVRVLATGRKVMVLKDTGRPTDTCTRYGVAAWEGYLAVAHTRMATESAVTVLHSHPFVPSRDLCVVHNGSFSNYAAVRRRLVADGIQFDSDNDSEVAARYLAQRLSAGDDLEEATRWVMKEMDGFFTLVISTADEMSVVRDAIACKPGVVAVTDGYVAVASEFRALAELPGIATAEVFEPQPEEVYTWSR